MTTAATTLSPGPLSEALKRNRASFNARFAKAQRAGAQIDPPAFVDHLATVLDPIIRSVAHQFSEKADAAAEALYDLSLELFTEHLLGPDSREPCIDEAWRKLLPALSRYLAREPRRIAASITNAVHNVAQVSGARPAQWIDQLLAVAPLCEDPQMLLAAGKIAAWRAGCPLYRQIALQTARSLNPTLLQNLFGISPQTSPSVIQKAIDAMTVNPWLDMSSALATPDPARLRLARIAGAFRGFGGPFLRPPAVAVEGDQLIASDGEYRWAIIADVYGSIFHRLNPGNIEKTMASRSVRCSTAGLVQWNGANAAFPDLLDPSSIACNSHTLAVTLSSSHHVFLIARG